MFPSEAIRDEVKKYARGIAYLFICVALLVGVLRFENLNHELQSERDRAVYAECRSVEKSLRPLRDIIIYTTNPSPDAAPGDGVAQQRIDATNASRKAAREAILPLIPEVNCDRLKKD